MRAFLIHRILWLCWLAELIRHHGTQPILKCLVSPVVVGSTVGWATGAQSQDEHWSSAVVPPEPGCRPRANCWRRMQHGLVCRQRRCGWKCVQPAPGKID